MSGDDYPQKIQACLDSWKKTLPDYEIWLWDTKRFDIEQSPWVKEAFETKRYAFCADYLRCYALYHYGGVYLDSDVEVLKSYNPLIKLPYFMGLESAGYIEAATLASEPNHPLWGKMLDYYQDRHFIKENGEPDIEVMPQVIMKVARANFQLKEIQSIEEFDYNPSVLCYFPYQYFSPIDTSGKRYELKVNNETYSIHQFANSWVSWQGRLLVWVFGKTSLMAYIRNVLISIRTLYKKCLRWKHK